MEQKSKKIFYSMGEVSEMLDVKPSLLRFWESRFAVIKPHKNKKGNRMFTPDDVENLKLIYHLVKERGMTLAGAEKFMKKDRDSVLRDNELAERLLTVRSLLEEIRQELGEHDGGESVTTIIASESITEVKNFKPAPAKTPIPDPEPNHAPVQEPQMEPEPAPIREPQQAPEPEIRTISEPASNPEPEIRNIPEPASTPEPKHELFSASKPEADPLPRIVEQTLF